MKFLIDECLSPELANIARNRGFPLSAHVRDLGLLTRPDWRIVPYAIRNGYAIATNDSEDFMRLLARTETHFGLVCLVADGGVMDRVTQEQLSKRALDELPNAPPVDWRLEVRRPAGRPATTRHFVIRRPP